MGSPPDVFFESGAIVLPHLATGKRVAIAHAPWSRSRDAGGVEIRLENDTELQHFATISGE
jgi:hypothetical protein